MCCSCLRVWTCAVRAWSVGRNASSLHITRACQLGGLPRGHCPYFPSSAPWAARRPVSRSSVVPPLRRKAVMQPDAGRLGSRDGLSAPVALRAWERIPAPSRAVETGSSASLGLLTRLQRASSHWPASQSNPFRQRGAGPGIHSHALRRWLRGVASAATVVAAGCVTTTVADTPARDRDAYAVCVRGCGDRGRSAAQPLDTGDATDESVQVAQRDLAACQSDCSAAYRPDDKDSVGLADSDPLVSDPASSSAPPAERAGNGYQRE